MKKALIPLALAACFSAQANNLTYFLVAPLTPAATLSTGSFSLTGGSTQAFGDVFVGNNAANTWTLSNSGQAAATLSYSTLPAGVVKSGTCGASLAGGASCTVILTWTPTAAGALASTTYTVGGQNLVFSGIAVAKTTTGTISATSHAFGSKVLHTTTTQALTLTNTGNQALTLAANVGSGISAPYTVTDNCGTSLAAGASCTATVTYKPTAAGAHNQTLTIGMGAAGNKTVALTGTAIAGAPSVTYSMEYDDYDTFDCNCEGYGQFFTFYPDQAVTITGVQILTPSLSYLTSYVLPNRANTIQIAVWDERGRFRTYQGSATLQLTWSNGTTTTVPSLSVDVREEWW